MLFIIFWLFSTIRSYLDTKSEEKSFEMEPPAKQQKIDVPTTSLIWLDDTSGDNPAQEELRNLDSNLKLFQNDTECENYIRSQPDQSLIVLIVNGRLGQQIIPRVQDLTQITAIYIYCFNKEYHQQWSKDIAKVKDVVIHFHDLMQQLQNNHFHTTTTATTEVNQPENDNQLNTEYSETDNQYIISDICFDYLSRTEPTAYEKDEFITSYQKICAGQPQSMAVLQVFQESYSSDQAVSWLQKNPSFCHILEDIFQSANTRTMYIFRSLIRDIQKQFEEHKCTSTILVYRGQLMSEENLQGLKNSVGKIIINKSFYSTSCYREVAMVFPLDPDGNKCVLFEIEANPKIEGTKPFMKTGLVYNQIDIDEVLFMIGSSFIINEIRDDGNGPVIVKMALCANEKENSIKSQLNINSERHDLIGYAQLLYNLSETLKYPDVLHHAVELLEKYLNDCPEDHPSRYQCYDVLGSATLAMSNLDACLNWTLKSFEIKKQFLQPNDPQLVQCYESLIHVYTMKGERTKALEPLQQILIICKQIFGDDDLNLVQYYLRMIEIYEYEGKYTDVLFNYNQIFNIMLKKYSIDDLNLAPIYSNIGKTWASLSQYPLALGYYQTSLDIKLKRLATPSDSTALSYKNIAFIHKDMKNIEQAKIHFEKAAAIYRELHSPTYEVVLEIEKLLQNLSSST